LTMQFQMLFAAVVRDGNGNTSGSTIFEIIAGLIGQGIDSAFGISAAFCS
jgi:hypothetical protein